MLTAELASASVTLSDINKGMNLVPGDTVGLAQFAARLLGKDCVTQEGLEGYVGRITRIEFDPAGEAAIMLLDGDIPICTICAGMEYELCENCLSITIDSGAIVVDKRHRQFFSS